MSDREEFGPVQGPTWHWTVKGVRVSRYRRAHRTDGRLWEAFAHGRGVSGHRTPLGALLHLRRWLREPVNPR